MSSEEQQGAAPPEPDAPPMDVAPLPTEPAAMAAAAKKRPRLDLTDGARERKRGKSMFGILLGTLNKAKIEDKERNASEAAKKRQLIEQRLQNKLRQETDSVRRAEEAKKDKTAANRKEEDLQLKDSIFKLRRSRLPLLANFLLTSDLIPSDESSPPPPSKDPLAPPPRTHPPPLYYLPAILTPAQEIFLARRKAEVNDAVEAEWAAFREERTAAIEEISQLRQRVAEEEARKKKEAPPAGDKMDTDAGTPAGDKPAAEAATTPHPEEQSHDVEMEVDDVTVAKEGSAAPEPEKKDDSAAMHADDDDAVEY